MRRLAISENHDGFSPVIDARPANPTPASNSGLNDNSAKTYPRSFDYFFRRVYILYAGFYAKHRLNAEGFDGFQLSGITKRRRSDYRFFVEEISSLSPVTYASLSFALPRRAIERTLSFVYHLSY